MYDQANYGPPIGNGSHPPRASTYQQHPPGPPHPNLLLQHRTQPPPQPLVQQAPHGVPPRMSQPGGHPLYQHGLTAPFPPVHTIPQVQAPLLPPNAGESLRQLPPSSGQQPQYSPHFRAQNVNHNPTVVSPLHCLPHPEMVRPPQPLRALPPPPPPPPRGQMPLRAAFYAPPPYPGGVQGVMQIPPPPPPPPTMSSFFTPTAYGCSDSHTFSVGPPPRQSCPLPTQPFAPLPTSSFSISKMSDAGSCAKVIDTNQASNETSTHDSSENREVSRRPEVGSQQGNVSSFNASETENLPPSRPMESKIVQEIEELCTSTADSDMEMEDDITLTEKDRDMNQSTRVLSNAKETDVKDPTDALKSLPECSLVHFPTEFSNLHGKGEGSTSKPTLVVHGQVMDIVHNAELPLDCHQGKIVSPLTNNLSPSSSLAADTTNSKTQSEIIKGGSPMRLIQEYASDNSSESDGELLHKEIKPLRVLPSLRATELAPMKDTSSSLATYTGLKSQNSKKKGKEGSENVFKSHLYHKSSDSSSMSVGDIKAAGIASISLRTGDGCQDNNPGNQSSVRDGSSHAHSYKKVSLDGGGAHDASKRGNTLKEAEEKTARSESASVKVDEFGRLLREASDDSDSDSGHASRHERRTKRGSSRSRSRSRSPLDRRRTRRSSRRRIDKRSRSRSWSPRNRRSRSRSPTSRRSGEFTSGKFRSNRGSAPECFDFLRGRCYRGASCRYMHHAVEKRDSSRSYRSDQKHPESRSGLNSLKRKQETKHISVKLSEHDDTRTVEIQGGKADWNKEDIFMDSGKTIVLDYGSELADSGMVKCQNPAEAAGSTWEMKIVLDKSSTSNLQIHGCRAFQEKSHEPPSVDGSLSESVYRSDVQNSGGDTFQVVHPLVKTSAIHQPQSNTSVAGAQNVDCPSRQVASSSFDALPNQTTLTSSNNVPNGESVSNNIMCTGSLINQISSQSFSGGPIVMQIPAAKQLSPCIADPTISHESSPLATPPPPPPACSPLQGANAPHMPQLPYSSMTHGASYPLQFAHGRNPQMTLVPEANQHAQVSVSPNPSWNLPPPPPRPPYDFLRFAPGVSSQFQPSRLPSRNEFGSQSTVRPYPTETISSSQIFVEHLHQSNFSIQQPPQPNLQLDNISSGNPVCQPEAPSLLRPDQLSHPTVGELSTSASLRHGNLDQKSVLSSQELSANRKLSFSGDPSSAVLSKSSAEIHSFSHTQQASSHLQYPLGDSSLGTPVKTGFMSQYLPDHKDNNQLCSASNFGLPRIVAHHNPYASTFDQPLGSKFGSAFTQDKDPLSENQYEVPSRNVTVDGLRVGSYGSGQTTPSPTSARVIEKNLPRACGELYDPLFDSGEPSSDAKRKECHSRNRDPASYSDRTKRSSGSQDKLLDLDETSRHEVTAVASTSLDNDEFGETADAEVGAVENESLSDPADAATAVEIETESKSKAKRKKSRKKDSRSMKPFKMAIADFVKDVLKPSWRQGNMSKESFKTIVKKTVDKVSGAMKGHNIPKSQSKIDQYIDSSQRKLTKLVMGYVDKYVKV